ncbi:MAG TPA: AIPR family protein [Terriglobia bacterium]|nr:AIPR family protein [Terriglobia bacterium]
MPKLQLTYPAIKKLIATQAVSQRTESRQCLAWFLENYYRLEETEIDDCICDGIDDKGIDGIYVNEQLAQIDVFQSRIKTKPAKTLGDTDLREFYGSLSQFNSERSVRNLEATTGNKELRRTLKDNEIAKKVGENYKVSGIFLTNAKRDGNAIHFLKSATNIILYDEIELEKSYVAIDKTEPISTSVNFDIKGMPYMDYPFGSGVSMVIAPVLASELVGMSGIANGELFAWNVRQWLGKKTKVNQDIEKSINNQDEHKFFPAFHNGLTVLCKMLQRSNGDVTISGYAVVNGCQSLTSLYENKKSITKDLRILTKFIQVSPETPLARKITDHTNNQNGTTHRDLQSNSPIQTRLQTEINTSYKDAYVYRIKRGEHPEWDKEEATVIENELAARILLAFDLKQPWSCHQTYKLFDELHPAIFGRPEVTGDRLLALWQIYKAGMDKLKLMKNELFAHYGLTKFLMLYLIREALSVDESGNELCQHPSTFIEQARGLDRIRHSTGKLAQTLARLLDSEISRRSDPEPFDFKRELKSQTTVRDLASTITAHYQITVDGKMARSFSEIWKESKTAKAL